MSTLSKQTIQRLAVLRALSLWKNGAYGPVRVHKTLFFADQNAGDREWHLFTFKKWRLGQYSDEIAAALNALRSAGCISTEYDGPSERIVPAVRSETLAKIEKLFRTFFDRWHDALAAAFDDWAYLSNDDVIQKAHENSSYTKRQHGEIIIESFTAEMVEFHGLSDENAESLSDSVDGKLRRGLLERAEIASQKQPRGEDWRNIYFGDRKQLT